MDRGYLQVYTGDGKGKTTAALGLAVRATGAGLSVCLIQFIKSMEYHELRILRQLAIGVHQFGRGCFITGPPGAEDIAAAARGLHFADETLQQRGADVVILDEINVALSLGLLQPHEVLEVLRRRPASVEVICTGRGASPELVEAADLVTEMVDRKHYYTAGVMARDGIER